MNNVLIMIRDTASDILIFLSLSPLESDCIVFNEVSRLRNHIKLERK
jgi:hypothetical protein